MAITTVLYEQVSPNLASFPGVVFKRADRTCMDTEVDCHVRLDAITTYGSLGTPHSYHLPHLEYSTPCQLSFLLSEKRKATQKCLFSFSVTSEKSHRFCSGRNRKCREKVFSHLRKSINICQVHVKTEMHKNN